MAKAKKQNFIAAYFSNFGLRQICDILMVIGAVVLIVGLCTVDIVLTIGFGVYAVAAALAIVRAAAVLVSGINHRAPEYKNAIVNICIMCVIFALTVFGFVWSLVA